jgi:hypothetical protein
VNSNIEKIKKNKIEQVQQYPDLTKFSKRIRNTWNLLLCIGDAELTNHNTSREILKIIMGRSSTRHPDVSLDTSWECRTFIIASALSIYVPFYSIGRLGVCTESRTYNWADSTVDQRLLNSSTVEL